MAEMLMFGPGGADREAQDRTNYLLGPKIVKIDYVGSDPLYIGTAPLGSGEADPVWTIQKLSYSGGQLTSVDAREQARWSQRTSPTIPWETP